MSESKYNDGIVRPACNDRHGRGVISLACDDDGYQESCPADQRGQQAGPNTHGVLLDLWVGGRQRSGNRSKFYL